MKALAAVLFPSAVFICIVGSLGADVEPPSLKAARDTLASESRQAEVTYHKALAAAKRKLLNELAEQVKLAKDANTIASLADEIKKLTDSIAEDDSIVAGKAQTQAQTRPDVVVFGDNNKMEDLFRGIAQVRGGNLHALKTTAEILGNKDTFKSTGVMVWSTNSLRSAPVQVFTENAQENIARFVRDGGDFWVFEQFSADHTKVLEAMFGIKVVGGGGKGANVDNAGLQKIVKSRAITPLVMQEVHFYNTYPQIPKGSEILLRGDKQSVTAFATPFGRGRLICVGTDDTGPLIEAIIELAYGKTSGSDQEGSNVGPASR